MKRTLILALTGGLIAAAGYHEASAAATKSKPAAKSAGVAVTPVVVDVVAVNPKAKTITVREIAAVPAPPGQPVEITLPVPAASTGQKLANTKAGEQVSITCAIKPTVHPTAGVPVVLSDCVKVVKIEPKS